MLLTTRRLYPVAALLTCLGAQTASAQINGVVQSAAANGTQEAVAVFVEEVCPRLVGLSMGGGNESQGTKDLRNRCTEIVVSSSSNVPDAQDGLQAMGAEEDSAIHAVEVDADTGHQSNVKNRVKGLRGATLAGVDAGTTGVAAGGLERGWGFFIDGVYGNGDKDTTSLETGFDMDALGVTAGLDRQISDTTILGGSIGYLDVDTDLKRGSGDIDTDGFTFQLYGTYFTDRFYVDGLVGYTMHDNDQDRRLNYTIAGLTGGTTVVNQVASSSTDSDTVFFSLAAGRNYQYDRWTLGPYARFDYSQTDIDGYTERMSSPTAPGSGLAVSIDSQDFTSTTLALGVQISSDFNAGSGVVIYPQLSVEYVHEFDNDNDGITGRFVDDVTRTPFRLPTDSPDRNYGNIGLGLVGDFGDGMSGHVAYQRLIGYDNLSLYAVEVGLRINF